MNCFRPYVLLAVFVFAPACKQLGAINWPEVIKCGLGDRALLGEITEILLGDGEPKAELEKLARTHGTDAIVCLVEALRSDWAAPAFEKMPGHERIVDRANAFLRETGTKFE